MRALTWLSIPQMGGWGAAGFAALVLRAAGRDMADFVALAGGGGGGVSEALARTVLVAGGVALRLAATFFTGSSFWILTGASGTSGSLNLRVVLRSATLEPAGILTACFLSLRMRVFLVTACSCAGLSVCWAEAWPYPLNLRVLVGLLVMRACLGRCL